MGTLFAKVGGSWQPVVSDTTMTQQEIWPAGSIRTTIAAAADPGWLLFGQTVANAMSLYPALWAVAPAGWKSGSSLVIPSDVDCGLRGSSTAGLGQVSGTNVKTIATANLPVHAHAIDHDHAAVTSGNDNAEHTHSVDIWSSYVNVEHYHAGYAGQNNVMLYGISGAGLTGGGAPFGTGTTHWSNAAAANYPTDPATALNHRHAINGTSGGRSAVHQHGVDLPNFVGSSGNAGSGTALNVQDAAINVRYQIKAH